MIGILDSGVGGLSIYRSLKKRMPGASVVYFADKKNFPYGGKTDDQLIDIVRLAVMTLLDNGAQVVVLACNSATVTAIDILRAEFTVPIVGVEPAIKLAAVKSISGNVGVLATQKTIVNHSAEALSQSSNLVKSHNGKLVDQIENDFNGIIDADIVSAIEPFQKEGVDTVVLGCTHYYFLRERLENLFPEICFISTEEEVTTRILTIMNDKRIGLGVQDDIFLVTSGIDEFRQSLHNLLELNNADVRKI